MFVIAIHMIASGAPSTAFTPAIPAINATLHLDIGNDDQWIIVPAGKEHGHGKIYMDLMEAHEAYNEIAGCVEAKEAIVAPITQYIGDFVERNLQGSCSLQVFFEIQKLSSIMLDERAVDLGMF
jgi:hypothetical protein